MGIGAGVFPYSGNRDTSDSRVAPRIYGGGKEAGLQRSRERTRTADRLARVAGRRGRIRPKMLIGRANRHNVEECCFELTAVRKFVRDSRRSSNMADWKRPEFVEIRMDAEINCYSSALADDPRRVLKQPLTRDDSETNQES
jgi:coenzyme PQQ precursor peptide PqqA